MSQFTLYGTVANKKHSPDYKDAMKSEQASASFDAFASLCAAEYDAARVKTGVFGEMMDVALVNDGPVTLVVDSRETWRDNMHALSGVAGDLRVARLAVVPRQLSSIGFPSASSSCWRMLPHPPLVCHLRVRSAFTLIEPDVHGTCVGGQDQPGDSPPGSSTLVHALRVCTIFVLYSRL